MIIAHPAWAAPYVGARYAKNGRTLEDGFDCIGLYLAIVRREAGIDLPEYDGPPWEGARTVKALGDAAEAFRNRFVEIDAGDVCAFDAVLLLSHRQPVHIGCVTTPGFMLHIDGSGADAVIESYLKSDYKDRIAGFYRPALRPPSCAIEAAA